VPELLRCNHGDTSLGAIRCSLALRLSSFACKVCRRNTRQYDITAVSTWLTIRCQLYTILSARERSYLYTVKYIKHHLLKHYISNPIFTSLELNVLKLNEVGNCRLANLLPFKKILIKYCYGLLSKIYFFLEDTSNRILPWYALYLIIIVVDYSKRNKRFYYLNLQSQMKTKL